MKSSREDGSDNVILTVFTPPFRQGIAVAPGDAVGAGETVAEAVGDAVAVAPGDAVVDGVIVIVAEGEAN
jgi:hypothetical protein